MTDAHSDSTPSRRWTAWLLATGAALAIVGLIGAFIAKHSADLASGLSSEHTRLVTPGGSSSATADIALQFAPTAAPDYTLLWLALTVTVVGLIVVLGGTIVALRKRQTA
jgi:hypothetical protein